MGKTLILVNNSLACTMHWERTDLIETLRADMHRVT